jgi:hypothetical protein
MPTFDSTEYAWKDLEAVVLGRPLIRVLEVQYDTEEDKKYIYGRGKKPLGIQDGNEKYPVQLTIGQSELEALTRKAQEVYVDKSKSAKDLVFDINIAYLGDAVVRDRIVKFHITKIGKGMKQGDSDMEVKITGMSEDILFNV